MKSLIIYYSQTGTTKAVAAAIREGIGELIPCDLARLQDVAAPDLAPYDLIGLGAPVWHRREPSCLMNFIEYSLTAAGGKHAFAFCTHGLLPGRFLARVVPALSQQGLTVVGWRNWYCAVTMPEKPKPYFTDGHPDSVDLAEAKAFGRDIADTSRRVFDGATDLVHTLPAGKDYDH